MSSTTFPETSSDLEAQLRQATERAASAEAKTRVLEERMRQLEFERESERIRTQERRARVRRWFELIVGFTAPPIVGLLILIDVMTGSAANAVIHSEAATSTA